MSKSIAIVAGEPNSISSEIIFKSWINKKKFTHKPFFIIGSFNLLKIQMKKMNYKIKMKKINNNFNLKDLSNNELPVYDVPYKQDKPFQKISIKSNKYIFKCFEIALRLVKNKKIVGFVNCPISKETLFKNNHQGITEFLSKKATKGGNVSMLIYNKKLSVSPITTHIPLNKVSKNINKDNIIKKILIINKFYKKILNIKPKFLILGVNPHNFSPLKENEEKIISKAILKLISLKINVKGPVSPDSSFINVNKKNFNIIIGMYHDQVLTPFKAIFNYDAINITLGLPFIRTSPDHGTAEKIVGKRMADPKSLIESIKFFNKIK